MVEVKFHDIGEGMTEGEIVSYLVQIGDEVKADQPLVEMQTDKMVAEIPSPASGKVSAIYYDPGTVVTIGSVLLEIDDGKKVRQEANSREEVSAGVVTPEKTIELPKEPKKKKPPKRIIAAPHTRRIARENDVDIEKIDGSGPAGRVLDEDIYRYVEAQNSGILQPSESPQEVHNTVNTPESLSSDTIPFTGIRRQIANKMTESLTTIPHVTHYDEVDLTNLLAFRETLKASGDSISVAAFFVKAIVLTLKKFPTFNAQLDEENEVIRLHKDYHIGLATNTDKGLLVPVLRDVDKKSIRTIQSEMKALTKKAQEGKLTVQEMSGGTFTISNVGPLGGIGATPIINHPQTSIIAFHKTKKIPVVMPDDSIEPRSIMTLSLSFDHRVMDGADSVMFTNYFNALIEEPNKLILELV